MRAPSILRSTLPRAVRATRRRAGFTLIELMVIVSIIAVMAALAAPGMMRAMSVNRAQRATLDVARIGRAGRSDAISFGRAYMLRVTPGAAGVELWRGITDTCRTTPWTTVMAAGGCTADPPAPDCVDHAAMASYSTTSSWTTLTTSVQGLCFEPDGDLWQWSGGNVFVEPVTAVTMRMQRFESGTPLEERGVIFPLIGAPRTER